MSIRLLYLIFAFAAIAAAQTFHPYSIFATGTAVSATGPDSITVGNGSVWVSYTNGADSMGASGRSTIVQYSLGGKVRHMYSIAGSVDGLKIEPRTGLVWALQNQDGNSTLTLIDPLQGTTSSFQYAVTSPSHGYDDVAFDGNKIFLSYYESGIGQRSDDSAPGKPEFAADRDPSANHGRDGGQPRNRAK